MQFRLGHVDSYIRTGSSFYCICTASHTAQWSNYVYYSAEALQRAFRQAGRWASGPPQQQTTLKNGISLLFLLCKGNPKTGWRGLWSIIGIRRQPLAPPSFLLLFLSSFLPPLADEGFLIWNRFAFYGFFCHRPSLQVPSKLATSTHTHTQCTHSACVVTDYYYYQSVSGQKAKTL